jgi:Spy/CpxP family protein refolding chaperone
MSIRQFRKSILITVGLGALAVAGLFAGRLSANAFPQSNHVDLAPRMFSRLSTAVGLTSDQQTQIKVVLRAHEIEIETQMKATRAARQALHAAVMASPIDEGAIRARAADVGSVHADGAVLFARIRAEIDPILTADQKTKLQTFQAGIHARNDNAVQSFHNFLNSGS